MNLCLHSNKNWGIKIKLKKSIPRKQEEKIIEAKLLNIYFAYYFDFETGML